MSMTKEELQTLRDAMAIWKRERSALSDFYDVRQRAAGRWPEDRIDYLSHATDTGIVTHHVYYDGDDGWDVNEISFSDEELLNMEHATAKFKAILDLIEAERQRVFEAKAAEQRRAQYEKLRAEFEGA